MKSHTLDRSNYSPLLLGRVAVGWRRLAEDERRGIVTSAHLAADLASLDAPAEILAMAGRVVQDEIHHLEVCARVLEELDPGARVSGRFECAIQRPAPDEAVLARTLVTEFALGKPVAAATFAAARALVREPLFGWAYTELLHDETRHATFGARAATWVIRTWSTQQRQALWTDCLTKRRPRHDAAPARRRGRGARPAARRDRLHAAALDPPPPRPARHPPAPRQRAGAGSLTGAPIARGPMAG